MKRFVIAITGASGACYAKRLFDVLKGRAELHVILSERGVELLNLELGLAPSCFSGEHVTLHRNGRVNASIASGSFPIDGMVVIPASMGTLARIACGISGNLIERAADVALKEKRRLILVPRETPLSAIHLENMLKLDRAGALILPANPGFYRQPQSVADIVDFVVARVLDHLGMEHDLSEPYQP